MNSTNLLAIFCLSNDGIYFKKIQTFIHPGTVRKEHLKPGKWQKIEIMMTKLVLRFHICDKMMTKLVLRFTYAHQIMFRKGHNTFWC